MLQSGGIWLVAIGYLSLIFAIAVLGERWRVGGRLLVNHPVVYALSIAVYCTSWTFFGSVGRAAATGPSFLAVYLGPILMFTLGVALLQKIIRVAKEQHIGSIADFISARYGRCQYLAGLVSIIAVVGIMPYIAMQLKATGTSFQLVGNFPDISAPPAIGATPVFQDSTFYIAIVMACFAILFGTRRIDASEQHSGMVAAIAFESVLKLVAFLAVGIFVTYGLFDGFGDLADRALTQPAIAELMDPGKAFGSSSFWVMTGLGALAVICLPRQFQVTVIENTDENHIRTAAWLFPAYLIAINIFVIPIALAGLLLFPNQEIAADTFVLALPMIAEQEWLTVFVFLGGLSAATGMVIVATIAIATMICNDLVMPFLLRSGLIEPGQDRAMTAVIKIIRRLAIITVLGLSYAYVRLIGDSYALVTIGLVSFCAAAQFAPALIGGVFWKKANRQGAITGLSFGFVLWAFTLLVPSFTHSGWIDASLMSDGLFGLSWLRPEAILGLGELDKVSHSLFWSLGGNLVLFVLVSLRTKTYPIDKQQARRFVDSDQSGSVEQQGYQGTIKVGDLITLVHRFSDWSKVENSFHEFFNTKGETLNPAKTADAEVLAFGEKLLAGHIGSASARVIMAATFQRNMRMDRMMDIIDDATLVIEQGRELLRDAVENIPQGISMFDSDLRLVVFNQRYADIMNLPPKLCRVGIKIEDLFRYNAHHGEYGPGNVNELVQQRLSLVQQEGDYIYERTRLNGRIIEVRGKNLPNGGCVRTYEDVTERHRINQAIADSEKRFRSVAQSANDAIITTDSNDVILSWNNAATSIFGYEEQEALGMKAGKLLAPGVSMGHAATQNLHDFLDDDQDGRVIELLGLDRSGTEFPMEVSIATWASGDGRYYSGFMRDISDRKKTEAQIRHLANHDGLTELPNRNLFKERMTVAMQQAKRDNTQVALFLLDLDNFKEINDTMGHMVGDKLLRRVAADILTCIREPDTAARLGGDEFAIIAPGLEEGSDAAFMAQRILESIEKPFLVEGNDIHTGTSIGITLFPSDATTADQLLRNADLAMYRAKNEGRGTYRFFEDAMDAEVRERKLLQIDLRRAMEKGELNLYYQPLIDLSTGQPIGMEALLRWWSPERGQVGPDTFIPIAEQSGLIIPIGDWVMRTACRQTRIWAENGMPNMKIAINLSPQQFRQDDLVQHIQNIVEETGIAPTSLEFEITEGTVMQDIDAAQDIMKKLSSLGISLAIDDFGTGYSSLSYLKRFPVSKVKIDRSFVKDLETDADGAAIATAIIKLGHSMNLTVVAEGVETQGQIDFLREEGCDIIQGFYYARPEPPEDFVRWIENHRGSQKSTV